MKQTWADRQKQHVHFNWDVVEVLTKGGSGNSYLADDGTYKVVSGGGGGGGEYQHDWVSPYSYCGKAPTGALTSSPVWEIYRIQVNNDGSTITLSANNVAWDNRYIVPYI